MEIDQTQQLGKALEIAKDYADAVIKGPLSEFGGILTDTVGFWRLKNRVRLMLKTKQWLEEKGVSPTKILPDVFIPLLEDGGNATDETLSDMFSSLLASHLDPNCQDSVHPSYTKVLSQLSPLDAQIMLLFRALASSVAVRDIGQRAKGEIVIKVSEKLSVTIKIAYISCLNLSRLGIVEQKGHRAPSNPGSIIIEASPEFQVFRITEYGIAFCDACQYSSRDKNGAA